MFYVALDTEQVDHFGDILPSQSLGLILKMLVRGSLLTQLTIIPF